LFYRHALKLIRGEKMPEKKSAPIGMSEIRKTTATSLGTAFGIVIGMIWTQVVTSGFNTAGINSRWCKLDAVGSVRNHSSRGYGDVCDCDSAYWKMGREEIVFAAQ
jgi:hypothetical protein